MTIATPSSASLGSKPRQLVKTGKNIGAASRFKVFEEKLREALGEKIPAKAVKKLCVEENEALKCTFNNDTTLRRYYTSYRNVCRKACSQKKKLLKVCLDILTLGKEKYNEIHKKYEAKVYQENGKLRPLKNPEQMMAKARLLLDAPSIYDCMLGLALLTGRRVAEIGCTASFQPLDENWMIFVGQLKGKTRSPVPYKIPALGDPMSLIRATMRLREARPLWVDQPILFHDTSSRELSLRVKKHFSEHIESPRVKDLRAAYAEIAHSKFGPRNMVKTHFFSQILGHNENDISTGLSYADFYIEKDGEQKFLG